MLVALTGSGVSGGVGKNRNSVWSGGTGVMVVAGRVITRQYSSGVMGGSDGSGDRNVGSGGGSWATVPARSVFIYASSNYRPVW